MIGIDTRGSTALDGLLGVLRSWMQDRWGLRSRPSDDRRDGVPAMAANPNAALKVLVVDDNPVHLMTMSALMASKGVPAMLACDGAEAVALVCRMRFDLVLMDIQMPVLNGLDATAAIRRFEHSFSRPTVPVIAFSSLSPHARDLAIHGLDGSLAKPCDDLDLENCLVRWCPAYLPLPASAAQGRSRHG
jgi:CheY-like chemotaxis protein